MAAEALKLAFNPRMAKRFAATVKEVYPQLNEAQFLQGLKKVFEPLELKERSFVLAERLQCQLPDDIPQALKIITTVLKNPNPGPEELANAGFFYWPFSDYIEHFATAYPDEAMACNYWLTQRFTAEFSIRPFLVSHPDQVLALLHQWAGDESEQVRRLVSEGTRPRLPWAKQLPAFIDNPAVLFPLLEKLLHDPSLYVRRSVANHLNDIGKDHPELVLDYIERWSKQGGEHLPWIIKQALRNHIKQGHIRALKLLGYTTPVVTVSEFKIEPSKIEMGQQVEFSFELKNDRKETQALMVDYVLYRPTAHGKLGKKVFKLKAFQIASKGRERFNKTQRFKKLSTRTYYPGKHEIAIHINGHEWARGSFEIFPKGAL